MPDEPCRTDIIKEGVGLIRDKFRGLLSAMLVAGFVWVGVKAGALQDMKDVCLVVVGFYFGARSNGNGNGAK
jgi:hypothetical protein